MRRLLIGAVVVVGCGGSELQEPNAAPLGGAAAATFEGCDGFGVGGISVGTTEALNAALRSARPGDVIRLLPNRVYGGGRSILSRSGTRSRPIIVCGPRSAVWTGELRADGMNWWIFQGFTIRDAFRAIHAKRSSHNRVQGLEIFNLEQEGIHWLCSSVANLVQGNWIHHTGTGAHPEWGEAVYIGTYKGNLAKQCGQATLDRSDSNQVLDNRFGPNVRAEDVDAKEGSRYGIIARNRSDGRGKVAIAGNFSGSISLQYRSRGYRVNGNIIEGGAATGGVTIGDAIQLFGEDATARGNRVTLGPATGYGVRVGGSGNVVYCDNTADPAARLSNVTCRAPTLVRN